MERDEIIRGLRESQLVNQLGAMRHPVVGLPIGEGKLAYAIANFLLDNRDMFMGILEDDLISEVELVG